MRPKREILPICTRARSAQRVAQPVLDFALVSLRLHVDEVDDDKTTQVLQAQLPSDFLGGFEFVRNAVSSMSPPRVARELTSIATSASVWSMTIAPPEGRAT